MRRSPRCRRGLLAGVALSLGLLDAAPAAAQVCWRGRPRPTCSSVVVTEFGLGVLLDPAATDRQLSEYGYARVAVGWLYNLTREDGVGATMGLRTGARDAMLAVGPRYRRWLPRNLAADGDVSLLLGRDLGLGLTGAVAWRDWVGLELGVEWTDETSHSPDWYGGLRLGAYLGTGVAIGASIATVLLYLAFLAAAD